MAKKKKTRKQKTLNDDPEMMTDSPGIDTDIPWLPDNIEILSIQQVYDLVDGRVRARPNQVIKTLSVSPIGSLPGNNLRAWLEYRKLELLQEIRDFLAYPVIHENPSPVECSNKTASGLMKEIGD